MAKFQVENHESDEIIIGSIILLYLLVDGFIYYFYFMKRISVTTLAMLLIIFSIVYAPRFYIIFKLLKKDQIKVNDDKIIINENGILFNDITDYTVEKGKPVIVFYVNGHSVNFTQSTIRIRLNSGETKSFNVYGREKIELLEHFLNNIVGR